MLLLFDIDGTLLRGATQAHGRAVHEALSAVYGVADPAAAHVEPAGRTDLEIARLILLDRGVSAARIDDGREDFRAACVEAYARLCPRSLTEHVVPGMGRLLDRLEAAPGVRLALVTGNLAPIAHLKLARAGIGHHFPPGQGAFGSDAEDRTQLAPIARQRAGTDGRPHARSATVLIGDTPRDIACARADGVRVIAVTTGPCGAQELAGADAVVPDADALARELEGMLDGA